MTHAYKPDPRAQLTAFLPDALETAILSYMEYSDAHRKNKKTEFSVFHKESKTALGHIESLFKLMKLLGLVDEPEAADDTLKKQKRAALDETDEAQED